MTSQNNALVEIALALAMAFFSIMVLAMVSMKVHGDSLQQSDRLKYNDNAAIDIRSGSQSSQTSSQAAGLVKISRDEVVIYYEGK